jgi:hyperosmotically inducible periplasmic protein
MKPHCLLCFFALGAVLTSDAFAQTHRGTADRLATENVLQPSAVAEDRISREVRHELVTLPYYGVFDNLAYRVDVSTVTLLGQVTRAALKDDAGKVVRNIAGVQRVNNQIQVLPPSAMDDQIRMTEYRAIYGLPGLDRYALQNIPPIHIIVDNGRVTLEGVVASQGDKDTAGIQARGVAGVFSVTNNLRVENR